jgi:hypothetical protein
MSPISKKACTDFSGGGGLLVLLFLPGFLRKTVAGRGVLMVNWW